MPQVHISGGTSIASIVAAVQGTLPALQTLMNSMVNAFLPVATIISNVDTVTPVAGKYGQVGDIVALAFWAAIDATTIGQDLIVEFTLPVASVFTQTTDCQGVVNYDAAAPIVITNPFSANTSNGKARLTYLTPSNVNKAFANFLTYKVR